MSEERTEDLGEVRARAREAVETLEVQAAEVLEITKRLEDITGGTSEWYLGMRTRVEAAEALRQARVLVRTLEGLDEGVFAAEDAKRCTA